MKLCLMEVTRFSVWHKGRHLRCVLKVKELSVEHCKDSFVKSGRSLHGIGLKETLRKTELWQNSYRNITSLNNNLVYTRTSR